LHRDRNLGEDAVQEAFAKALRKRRSFRSRGTLEAWVWRIVLNTAAMPGGELPFLICANLARLTGPEGRR